MTVVVDASVVVAALVDSGRHGQWAEQILAGGALASPELVLAEGLNVLRRLEANGTLSATFANGAFGDLLRLEVSLFGFPPLARRIWQLRSTINACDAWYVALAESLSCPLATLDRRLTRASGARCDFLVP